MENALAILLVHMKSVPCQRSSSDSQMGDQSKSLSNSAYDDVGSEDAQARLGSPSDLAYFGSRLKETCLKVEALVTQRKDEPCLLQGHRSSTVEGIDTINKRLKGLIALVS